MTSQATVDAKASHSRSRLEVDRIGYHMAETWLLLDWEDMRLIQGSLSKRFAGVTNLHQVCGSGANWASNVPPIRVTASYLTWQVFISETLPKLSSTTLREKIHVV